MEIYVARLSYGKPELMKVQAEEKPKTYRVEDRSVEVILGNQFFYGVVLNKWAYNIFETELDALAYLYTEAGKAKDAALQQAAELREQRKMLAEAILKLKGVRS